MKNFDKLERFTKQKECFKLTKLSKNPSSGSFIEEGESREGYYKLLEVVNVKPELFGVRVFIGGESSYFKTSLVKRVISFNENSTVFETQGGVYKLERKS